MVEQVENKIIWKGKLWARSEIVKKLTEADSSYVLSRKQYQCQFLSLLAMYDLWHVVSWTGKIHAYANTCICKTDRHVGVAPAHWWHSVTMKLTEAHSGAGAEQSAQWRLLMLAYTSSTIYTPNQIKHTALITVATYLSTQATTNNQRQFNHPTK